MNMYSLLTNNPNPTKDEVEKYFDGNLCRCTGFRPILDAFKSFATKGITPIFLLDIYALSENEPEPVKGKCGGVCGDPSQGCKNLCRLSKAIPDIEELSLPEVQTCLQLIF